MKKGLLLLGLVLVLVFGAAYLTSQYKISEPEITLASTLDLGTAEPTANFVLSNLEGNQVALQDLKGKNVFINFWATWCKWCVHEMPDMEKVHQAYKDEDLVILAIAVGEDHKKVSDYLQDKGYTFEILLDLDKSVARAYEVKSIPTSIFIDKEGNVFHKRIGVMDEEQMSAIVEQLNVH